MVGEGNIFGGTEPDRDRLRDRVCTLTGRVQMQTGFCLWSSVGSWSLTYVGLGGRT